MENLQKFLETNNIVFDKVNTIKSFVDFKNSLQKENKVMNLIGNDHDKFIEDVLFIDSLITFLPIKHVWTNSLKVLDIGIGAGFPSLPLKLINSQVELYGIDSLTKRINYLNKVKQDLCLDKCTFINGRAEEVIYSQPKLRESFDIVTARSVASLKVLLELCIPYLKLNGILVLPKSKKLDEEIKEAKLMFYKLGDCTYEINEYVSFSKIEHKILVIKKNQHTDKEYPREWIRIIK